MFYNERSKFYNQIELLIEKSGIEFDELLSINDIQSAINQRLPNLKNYIIHHVSDLLNHSFSFEYDENVRNLCLSIIINSSDVKSEICKDKNLINCLINYFENEFIGKDNFYILLQNLIANFGCTFLKNLPSGKKFLEMIIKDIHFLSCYEFLIYIFYWDYDDLILKWLMKNDIDLILYSQLKKQSIEACRSMNLLVILLLDERESSFKIKKLSNIDIIKEILELALSSTMNEFSESAFNYIILISNQCDDTDEEGKESVFDQIINIITDNFQELCNYVQKDHSFQGNKKYAIELITTIISVQDEVNPFTFYFADFLFHLFLELKTNSFLHSSYFTFFQAFSNAKNFLNYINKYKYIESLVKVLNDKDKIVASFWGHINQIIEIINNLIIQKRITIKEEWINVIQKELKIKESILSQNY